MEPDVQTFGVSKLGNSAEEYEDAVSSSSEGRRFAIADGATQTSFADRWSQILSLEFIMNPPSNEPLPNRWIKWLQPLQEAWSAGIPWDTLPWFANEKARVGACTTLLALEFMPGSTTNNGPGLSMWQRMLGVARPAAMNWRAEAVGDSCLFLVRNDRLIRSFPLERPTQFTHSPALITTNPDQNELVCKHIKTLEGECQPGDLFLLMTDALAKWFLQRHVAGEKPWQLLREINDEMMFKQFVIQQRDEGRIENDDTTLMIIQWPEQEGANS
jgi:hypothetical protein